MKPLRNSGFGTLINGSWDGMMGQLQRQVVLQISQCMKKSYFSTFLGIQEIDLAASPFEGIGEITYDLAAYTRSEEYVMVTQYPAPHSSTYGHIITFSPGVLYHYI